MAVTIATNWRFGEGMSLLVSDAISAMRNFKEGDLVLRAADMFAALSGHLDKARKKIERLPQGEAQDGSGTSSWLDTVAEAEDWDIVLHPVELEAATRAAGNQGKAQ